MPIHHQANVRYNRIKEVQVLKNVLYNLKNGVER